MSFYNLRKEERIHVVGRINKQVLSDIKSARKKHLLNYFSDEDTYIRKAAYQAIGKVYHTNEKLRKPVIHQLENLLENKNPKVRQTAINSAGEVGMKDWKAIIHLMEKGLFDEHHSVRNAVIGSMKKAGEKNPKPVLAFAKKYLNHPDREIRREICHGIELRGRTHPEDILPLLKKLQYDTTSRVRNTLVHVLGQIAYKKGCLETVITDLKKWENRELVLDAIDEIIDVHGRYKNFAVLTQQEAKDYIEKHF